MQWIKMQKTVEITHIHWNFLWKDEDVCGLNKGSILIEFMALQMNNFMALHMNNFSWILSVYEYYFIEKMNNISKHLSKVT